MLRGLYDGFPEAEQAGALQYLRSGATTTPGLAIKAAGSPDVQAAAFSYCLGGKLYAKAAQATLSLAALGTVSAGATKTAFLGIDKGGAVTVVGVAAVNGVTTVPEPADGVCWFGAIMVTTTTAACVAGTTALDAAGLTVTYIGLSGIVPGDIL